MKVSTEKLQNSQVKLTVEITPEEVQPFLENAAKELSKKHTVKGFRPGSVPFEVMRSAIGDAHISEEALQKLVPKTYVDALLDNPDIEAIGRPEVNVKEVSLGKPWVYEAVVAVLPEVELGDYKSIKEKVNEASVDAKEIDQELDNLRKMRASFINVPREAQKNDRLEVDIKLSVDNVPLEQGNARKQVIILGDGQLFPEFENQILGMREGESKQFPIKFPDNHPQQDLRGKTVDFSVKVLNIQQQVLPELNDTFAQGLGKFNSLEDLKQKLTDNIKREKKLKEKQRVQQSLLEQVVKKTNFQEIPAVMIDSEVGKMLAELEDGISSMGLTLDQYLQQIKKTPDEMRKSFEPQAIERIKAGLTLRQIAKAENVDIKDEEVQEKINEFLKQFPSVEEAKKKIDLEALTEVTVGTIRNNKVFTLLEKFAGVA